MPQSQIQCNRYKMFRSIAGVFIVSLAIQANFAFIDYARETVTLKLSDKDLVQTIAVSNHKVYTFNVKRCILDEKLKRATYNSTKELIFLLRVFSKIRLKKVSLLLILYLLPQLADAPLYSNWNVLAPTDSNKLFAFVAFVKIFICTNIYNLVVNNARIIENYDYGLLYKLEHFI